MLENLTERLSRIAKTIRGEARLTESNVQEALREVRLALLEADVALPVVRDFIARVREAALGEQVIGSLSPGQALVGVVHRELAATMGGENTALDLAVTPPAVVLFAGLQGSGKTTTAAKLAKLLVTEQKKKPLLASCDVYRPAAIEQLQTLARQIGVDFFPSDAGQKPLAIALAAPPYTHSTEFRLHLALAMIAYGMFTIAALHALLMTLMERRLHGGTIVGPLAALPPLLTMERLLFRVILAGFAFLTLTLLTGIVFSETLFGRAMKFDHKTVFAVVSWFIFAALLAGRYFYGWRGRIALRWTLAGFVALLLAYVGSRFVLEVILRRGLA